MGEDIMTNGIIKGLPSATRRFATGAVRDETLGKGRFDLLPGFAMELLAQHFQEGGAKYTDRNFERGIPLSVYMDSGLRHAFKHLRGDRDENHLTAACWNFICALHTSVMIEKALLPAELNDLPNHHCAQIDPSAPEVL
jgi:dATP/dGTP diphosphohydrolase